MIKKLLRGDIWFVDLDSVVGHEQAKKRPCLIISVDSFNKSGSDLAVIVPLTSKFKNISWYVPVDALQTTATAKSYIICNQLRTVSAERFVGRCLGTVPAHVMEQVEYRPRFLLGL